MLKSLTIHQFFEKMAKEPPPGGGSAAALSGLMGVSLLEMAAEISLKHADLRFASAEPLIAAQSTLQQLHRELLELIDHDARVLAKVLPILSQPDDNSSQMNEAVQQAIEVPLAIASSALSAMKMSKILLDGAAEHVIGDLMLGALSCHNALTGALLMTALNLPLLSDAEMHEEFSQQVQAYTTTAQNLITDIQATVYAKPAYQVLRI
jgi:formiminotetrahydrofolate cyclodeaminase